MPLMWVPVFTYKKRKPPTKKEQKEFEAMCDQVLAIMKRISNG